MNFNEQDYERLTTWEPHFRTMTESGFCRNIRSAEIDELDAIWNRNRNDNRRTNKNCGACLHDFIKKLAPLYFADKAERAQTAARTAKTGKNTTATAKAAKTGGKR